MCRDFPSQVPKKTKISQLSVSRICLVSVNTKATKSSRLLTCYYPLAKRSTDVLTSQKSPSQVSLKTISRSSRLSTPDSVILSSSSCPTLCTCWYGRWLSVSWWPSMSSPLAEFSTRTCSSWCSKFRFVSKRLEFQSALVLVEQTNKPNPFEHERVSSRDITLVAKGAPMVVLCDDTASIT